MHLRFEQGLNCAPCLVIGLGRAQARVLRQKARTHRLLAQQLCAGALAQKLLIQHLASFVQRDTVDASDLDRGSSDFRAFAGAGTAAAAGGG
ncbi:hypothetical protein D3C72_2341760 [compost metagenome]